MGFFRDVGDDFRAYSKASPGRLNGVVTPLLMLGLYVAFSYRVRARLHKIPIVGVLISKVLGLFTNIATGCYISPKAKIAGGFYLPHPIGVVIGDKVQIGARSRIYQGVTLGSRATSEKAYPVLGDDVTVFPNSVVVGAIVLGSNSIVGAGSVVLHGAPEHSVIAGNPAKVVRSKSVA